MPDRSPLLARLLDTGDFLLRLAYFAAGPSFLLVFAVDYPLTGAVLNIVLLLAILIARSLLPDVHLTRKLFGRAVRLEHYYRRHPAKPFLYYVVLPVLVPYWLFYRPARREIRLYRSFELGAIVIMLAPRAWDYFAHWRPAIPFRMFATVSGASLLLEAFIFFVFMVPITTTVVNFKLQGATKRLIALAVVAALSLAVGTVGLMQRKKHKVRSDVAMRMALRAGLYSKEARAAEEDALLRAHAALSPAPLPHATWASPILGAPRDAAEVALEKLFLPDEAAAFFLYTTKDAGGGDALVVYAISDNPKRRPSPWRALVIDEATGAARFTSEPHDLVDHALP